MGKVQEEELDSCRAAGERGSAIRRDEGPGETKGVSPGAIYVACVGHKTAPDESGANVDEVTRLSSCPPLSVRTI